MRPAVIARLFFVAYCLEAGLFLVMLPWSPSWDRAVFQLPPAALRLALLHPLVRSALTGFGFVHLIWGSQDFVALWSRRDAASAPDPAHAPDSKAEA